VGVLGSAALIIVLQGMFLVAPAQSNPRKSASNPKSGPQKKYRLRIQQGQVIGISLKADEARLADIAGDLGKRLNTRILLGPAMEKQLVTTEFIGLPLDVALQLLAPRVYVDYEIRSGAPPTRVGILLFAADDPRPAASALVTGDSQAFMVEGNTEDTPESASTDEKDPLQVKLDGDHLSVKSRRQPLAAVIMTVAEVLGVPAEVKYDAAEIVDTEIKKVLLEDAIPRLSPNVRLFVRADLTQFTRTPLRLRLVAPEKVDGQ
jgi:hypothetical protein